MGEVCEWERFMNGENEKLGKRLDDSSMLQGRCMQTVLMPNLYTY